MEDLNAQDSTRNSAPEGSQNFSALPPDLRSSRGQQFGDSPLPPPASRATAPGKGSKQSRQSLELPTMGQSAVAVADPSTQQNSSKGKANATKGKTKGQFGKKAKRKAKGNQPQATPPDDKARSFSVLRWSLGLTSVLLGLGGVGVLGALSGGAIAHFFPDSTPSENAPLLEQALTRGSRVLGGVGRWPKQGAQGLVNRLDPPAQPVLEAAAPILTDGQRQQIGNEVATLQNELAQMNVRAAALEQQLGYQYADAPMELRLEALAQTIANPSAGPQSVANRDRQRQPLLVTLPMDPLFETNQSQLKPASTALLGAIVSELRSYPAGVVTIGAHSDDVGAGPVKRELSRRRAQAVAEYLQAQVGDAAGNAPNNRFLWNLVGYGDAEPLVPNEGNANRQRNRRLEIKVTPR